jgi:putative ABC transport system permease protein
MSSSEIMRRCRELGQISISEVLANRLTLEEGDELELPTPNGVQRLVIAGVFYDYRTEGGMVIMDRSTYHRYWPDDHRYTSVGLYLESATDPERVRTLIRRDLERSQEVFITSNRELRQEILRIFDQTFAITYALQVIAIIVAIFGIVTL